MSQTTVGTDCHLLGMWQSRALPQGVPTDAEGVKPRQPAGSSANRGPEVKSQPWGVVSSSYGRDEYPHSSGKCQEGQASRTASLLPSLCQSKAVSAGCENSRLVTRGGGPRICSDVSATSKTLSQPSSAGSAQTQY